MAIHPGVGVCQIRRRLAIMILDKKLVRFFVVGLSSALTYFGLSYFLQTELDWRPFWASIIAYGFAFGFAYLCQRNWTFQSTLLHRKSLPRYAGVQIFCSFCAATVEQLSSSFGGLSPQFTAAIAAMSAGLLGFILSLLWVFSNVND